MRRLIVITLLAAVAAAASSAPLSSAKTRPSLAAQLALARIATAKYVTDLGRAKADGYQIITRMIPSMGYHYLNPKVTGFDVRKPPILVYIHRNASWQLGALEWVFPKKPKTPPIQGARYGAFAAACHYVDGTFVFADSQDECARTSPTTRAKFGVWHPPCAFETDRRKLLLTQTFALSQVTAMELQLLRGETANLAWVVERTVEGEHGRSVDDLRASATVGDP